MDFSFSEEQRLLRDALGGYLRDRYDFDKRRAMLARPEGRDPAVWRAFAEELGILGAGVAEDLGGLGGGAIEHMVVMEALGGALVVEPYLETAVIAAGVLGRAGDAATVERIVAGEAIVAFAWAEPQGRYDLARVQTRARRDGDGWRISGHKSVVAAAPWATHLLVTARTGGGEAERGGLSLFLVETAASGVAMQDYPTVDERRAAEVRFDEAPATLVGAEGAGYDLAEQAVDEGIAALCAEAVGVMRRLYADTLDYAKQRRQFGRPIGEFQVLQHRLVDMFLTLEQAVSMTYMAALKLGEPAAERGKAVSAAKVQVSRACRFVGQQAVQIHGGIGMTDELALSHYFRRATMIESQFGDAAWHLKRYQALSLGRAA